MDEIIKLLDVSNPKRLKTVLNQILEYYREQQAQFTDKVSTDQGVENVGKVLAVNEEGKVEPIPTIDGKGLFVLEVKDGNLVMHQEYVENAVFTIGDDGYMRISIE